MKVFAPAKINLSLKILHSREDGFHEIESLMAPISLSDVLEFDPGEEELALSCSDPRLPIDDSNLVLRATHLFVEETGRVPKGRLHLTKHIPFGAGLGGGSSDAAATLKLWDAFFQTQLSHERLEEMASRIGSDVPFFVQSRPAWCRGRGEQITPTPVLPAWPIALLKPPFEISTPWAYQHWKNEGKSEAVQTIDGVALTNDLESSVFSKFLLLPVMKTWLQEQPEVRAALMTGSGSTLFAVLQEGATTDALFARAKELFGSTLWTSAVRLGGEGAEVSDSGL